MYMGIVRLDPADCDTSRKGTKRSIQF